jgi:hypothetical protein
MRSDAVRTHLLLDWYHWLHRSCSKLWDRRDRGQIVVVVEHDHRRKDLALDGSSDGRCSYRCACQYGRSRRPPRGLLTFLGSVGSRALRSTTGRDWLPICIELKCRHQYTPTRALANTLTLGLFFDPRARPPLFGSLHRALSSVAVDTQY